MDDFDDKIPWRIRFERLVARIFESFARLGALLVWPFEFCLQFCLRVVLGGAERVENADFLPSSALGWLFAPFRWLWFLCGQVLAVIRKFVIWPLEALLFKTMRPLLGTLQASDEQSFESTQAPSALAAWWQRQQEAFAESTGAARWLRAIVMGPFLATGYLTARIFQAFVWTAELLNLDGLLAGLIRWTRPLWYPLVAFGAFFWAWFVTRSQRQLAWGIPLALALTPAAWILAQNVLWGKSRIADQYRSAAVLARDAQAFDRLQLYERKLAQLGVNTDATIFRSALELAQAGKLDEAYERMRTIAPEDRPGYAGAHYWIVQNILADRLKLPADRRSQAVDAHLARLKELGIKAAEVDILRATSLAQSGKVAEASALLEPLVQTHPAAAIARLRLDLMLGRPDAARSDAKIVVDNMDRTKRSGKALSPDDFRWWAIAEDVLSHKSRLQAVLNDWAKSDPDHSDAQEMLNRVAFEQLTEQLNAPSTDAAQIAATIRQAFSGKNVSTDVRSHTFKLYRGRATKPVLKMAFENLAHANDLPPALADVLGTAAAAEDDWATAQPMLEHVVRQTPEDAAAWNNLAFVMLKHGADLNQALAAAETAVKSDPNNFHYRETRGQILVQLGRWQGAIGDLEFAVNGLPNVSSIHAALAKAYAAVGNSELAAIHAQYSQ